MIDKEELINIFIANFVQKERRERSYLELTNTKKRNKFTDRLNHRWDSVLNMKLLSEITKEQDSPEKIRKLIGIKDHELCYVISDYGEYDDQFLPFGMAFGAIYTRGFATLLINSTGDNLFLDTEQTQGHTPRFVGKKLQ